MIHPVHILWVDDYHLGDPLFAQSLARTLAQASVGELRALIVHGGGERAERVLESRGGTPKRIHGVLATGSEQDRDLIERAIREVNKTLTSVLTEFSVPAVGIQGSDRGLLKIGSDGMIATGPFSWVRAIIATGSVPVVSALAVAQDHVDEVSVSNCIEHIAREFARGECVIVCFTRSDRAGLFEGPDHRAEVSAEFLEETMEMSEIRTVRILSEAGYEVRFTSARHAISSDLDLYTRIS